MTLLLLPGGLNERAIKSLKDTDLWSNRVEPSIISRSERDADPGRVLLCYNGFGEGADRDENGQEVS